MEPTNSPKNPKNQFCCCTEKTRRKIGGLCRFARDTMVTKELEDKDKEE